MVSEYRNVGATNELDDSITWRCGRANRVVRNREIRDLLRKDSMKPVVARRPVHIKGNRI
jgi:hypothetical protein